MADSQSRDIAGLLANCPTESLDLELKEWIDISTAPGKAKVAKACLALRNNDGGRLVIGFDDQGEQCTTPNGVNIRDAYSADLIQEIVGKYASSPFAVEVTYIEVNGTKHPIVVVPSGIKSPVICKSDLTDDNGKPLLRDNTLYVRSVTSNNRVSSSEIRRGDWERLLGLCFDNRESDIGRFVRRHLVEIIDPGLLQATATHGKSAAVFETLESGRTRFTQLCSEKKCAVPAELGFREFSVQVLGAPKDQIPNLSLMQQIDRNTPRVSGWSPWVILLGARDEAIRPFVCDGRIEAFINSLSGGFTGPHLDYWSIQTTGKFYHIRGLEDDLAIDMQGNQRVPPGTALDFLLQIARVAEGLAVALSIANTLGFDPEETQVRFAARWQGISGRYLNSWVEPARSFVSWGRAVADSFSFDVKVPLNTPKSDMPTFVKPIIDNLFAVFGGTEIDERVLRDIATRTLDRNL